MTPETTGQMFADMLGVLGGILVENLPLVLGVLAALIGLGYLIYRVRAWISSGIDDMELVIWDDSMSDEQNSEIIGYYRKHKARYMYDYYIRRY